MSYTVTAYVLFLGAQDSATGHFQLGYTIHSALMRIFPRGTATTLGNGYFTRYNLTGFTNYSFDEGDVVLDSFGKYYTILSLKPWTNGDELAFFECELEERPNFPFISGFFGFEDEDHGTLGCLFEEGFQRGYFAL